MVKAALIVHGQDRNNFLPNSFDEALILAVDGGLQYFTQLAQLPHYWIGDGDSLGKEFYHLLPPKERCIQLQKDKDYSDTEEAILFAQEKGVSVITIYGGGGGRLDHLYNNLFLIKKYSTVRNWETSFESMEVIQGEVEFHWKLGSVVSLLPLDSGSRVLSTEGFVWPTERWDFSQGISLSNRTKEEKATILMEGGRFLLVKPREV